MNFPGIDNFKVNIGFAPHWLIDKLREAGEQYVQGLEDFRDSYSDHLDTSNSATESNYYTEMYLVEYDAPLSKTVSYVFLPCGELSEPFGNSSDYSIAGNLDTNDLRLNSQGWLNLYMVMIGLSRMNMSGLMIVHEPTIDAEELLSLATERTEDNSVIALAFTDEQFENSLFRMLSQLSQDGGEFEHEGTVFREKKTTGEVRKSKTDKFHRRESGYDSGTHYGKK